LSGDLAYERGTFTMAMADKASGASIGSVTNRHVHLFRREADGRWLGWRLIENSPAAPRTP
jgi:ketosteroid isomerase-like protein